MTQEEALSGLYRWRVWRYQQAMEMGTFWVPSEERSIYRRRAGDWQRECKQLFGVDAPVFEGARWKVRDMVPELRPPLVYVRGGKDPWRGLGLEPDYPLKNGTILSYEKAFHCPDRGTETGLEVIDTILTFIEKEKSI